MVQIQSVNSDRLAGLSFAGVQRFARVRRRLRFDPASIGRRQDAEPGESLSPFIAWLLARSGVDARLYRTRPLERRLNACLRSIRAGCVEDAFERLTEQPSLVPRAIDALLLGVTEFFRDGPVFDELDALLPERVGADGAIRVWSAACSNGAELYSIAMLLAERDLLNRAVLLGTDCRTEAIRAARAGRYGSPELAGVPPWLLNRYFEPVDSVYQVAESVRRVAAWEVRDLLSSEPGGDWDVILCRNTAIYLDSTAAQTLWTRLTGKLRPGGILVTGRAERPYGRLPLVRLSRCIYQKSRGDGDGHSRQ